MSAYNYYKATFRCVTARRARLMGIPVSRHYGYYVLVDPPVCDAGRRPGMEAVESWCATKYVAERSAEDRRDAQRKGYYGCPCGWQGQARGCRHCGKVNAD